MTYIERAAEARRNIPKVIRLLLAVTGRQSKDLAEALGMPGSRLSERLSGKVRISSEELAVCALFFGVDEGLFYRDPDSFRRQIIGGATLNGDTVGYRASAGHGPFAGGVTRAGAASDSTPAAA